MSNSDLDVVREIKNLEILKREIQEHLREEQLSQKELILAGEKYFALHGQIKALSAQVAYSKRQQMNIRISHNDSNVLDEICECWSNNPTNQSLQFLGHFFEADDLKSKISLASRLLVSSINALSLDVRNQKQIDSLAMHLYNQYLFPGSKKDKDVVKQECLQWAGANWPAGESEELFELIWDISWDRAQDHLRADFDARHDEELEYRKAQLKKYRGKSISEHS